MSRAIHATQPAKASPTSTVGKKTSETTQTARKSSQRNMAALKREGTDPTPGEKANDVTPTNQPFAINAARKRIRGGGDWSIAGSSSCAANQAVSPAASELSMAPHACWGVGRASVPFRFSADGIDRQR